MALGQFCFCISLKGGIAIAAALEVYWTMATVIDALFFLLDPDVIFMLTVSGIILTEKNWSYYIIVYELLMGVLGFFCLIKALATARRIYIVPWFFIAACHCISTMILSIVFLYFGITEEHTLQISVCSIYIFFTLFYLYLVYVVYTYYRQLRDGRYLESTRGTSFATAGTSTTIPPTGQMKTSPMG